MAVKIEDFIKHLQKVAEEHPGIEVWTSRDSEGNGFNAIGNPERCIGIFHAQADEHGYTDWLRDEQEMKEALEVDPQDAEHWKQILVIWP